MGRTSLLPAVKIRLYQHFRSAPSRTRTDTVRILSRTFRPSCGSCITAPRSISGCKSPFQTMQKRHERSISGCGICLPSSASCRPSADTVLTRPNVTQLARRALAHNLRDARGSRRRGFMLPDAKHTPSGLYEHLVNLPVSRDVAPKLLPPKCRVCSRGRVMVRAAVPETAVEKNGDLTTREHYVSRAADLRNGSRIHAVPKPKTVKFSPQRHLGPGVSRAVCQH